MPEMIFEMSKFGGKSYNRILYSSDNKLTRATSSHIDKSQIYNAERRLDVVLYCYISLKTVQDS